MPAISYAASVEEYLAFEAEAEEKHEYYGPGGIVAMAGASPDHGLIAGNLFAELRRQLRPRGCRTFVADLRVHAVWRYFYPDVVAVCDEPAYGEQQPVSLLNPMLIIEVTSASTAEKDRGEKLEAYLAIESLQEYWIVEQETARVTRYVRQGDAWTVHFVQGLDATIESEGLGVAIPMREAYAQVEPHEPFTPPSPEEVEGFKP